MTPRAGARDRRGPRRWRTETWTSLWTLLGPVGPEPRDWLVGRCVDYSGRRNPRGL